MRRRLAAPISTGRVLAVVIVTCVMMGLINVAANALLFRALCGVIVSQSEAFRETPPTSPAGQAAAEEWHAAARRICRV